jgi:benzil reductase ((S)-benzoin forming)
MTPTHLTIVTGSSRGLGAALVHALLAPGNRVLGIARHVNDALQRHASATGADLTQWRADLAEPLPLARRLRDWLAAHDAARIASVTLINNAGVTGVPAPAAQVPLQDLSRSLRVGLEATMLLSAAFLRATADWPARRRLVNISSGLGRRAIAGSAAYCAAKAGMDNFSRALALEEAARPNPARVESIAPGIIDTDMQAGLRAADATAFPERARFVQFHAQGLLASPADCARRLLAQLARADFGAETVTDLRAV